MFNLFPNLKEGDPEPHISIVGCHRGEQQKNTINDQPDHVGHFMFESDYEVIVGHITIDDEWLPDRVGTSYAQGRIDSVRGAGEMEAQPPDSAIVVPWENLPDQIKNQFPKPSEAANEEEDKNDDDLHTGQYL
jgi:hypothetical protein